MTVKRVITRNNNVAASLEGQLQYKGPVAKVWTDEVEASAEVQLRNMLSLPIIHKHVAVMPDVHWGNGTTVGSVIPTVNAIVPAAVGVDIGCGMMAHKLSLRASDLPDSLSATRSAIEAAVPHGRTDNGGRNDRGAWGEAPDRVGIEMTRLVNDSRYDVLFPYGLADADRAVRQLGTLGTGNHFIELCTDTEGGVWVMLHSGSRGIGNKIGSNFISIAKREMEAYSIELADPNLAYLPTASPHFEAYWKALSWAQDYARTNRELMMRATLAALERVLDRPDLDTTELAVNCHHNYVSREHHYGKSVFVTRKGAVRARTGDLGIIPGSMGAKSFIVRGRGNPESFDSCSHGAGRRLSRGAARARYSVSDLAGQTAGVECRKDADVIDEIPAAYKDIDIVMANQSDLVEILYTLKQVVCVKG